MRWNPLQCLGASIQRLHLALVVALLLSFAPSVAPVTYGDAPGQIIVQPASGATIDQINAKHNTKTLLKFTGSAQALISTQTLAATSAALSNDRALVAWIETNDKAKQPKAKDDSGSDPYTVRLLLDVTAPKLFLTQWGVEKISLEPAQRRTQGEGVTIAVLDTQVDPRHPALAGHVLSEIDLVGLDPQVNARVAGHDRGHGTLVAGLALRTAPKAKILPVRVLNDDGVGSVATVAEGIRRAATSGARVINMSLSTSSQSRSLQEAVKFAGDRGVVMVAAYGNDNQQNPQVYPAGYSEVIAVAATDERDQRAGFSNYGKPADVGAPGVNVIGPYRDGKWAIGSGTSFATPWVSGQAALLLSAGVDRGRIEQRIVQTADDLRQWNQGRAGFGRIDVAESLGIDVGPDGARDRGRNN